MARRRLFGAALKAWRKARGRKSTSSRSRRRPRGRTSPPPSGRRSRRRATSPATPMRRSSRRREPGGLLGFLSQVIWPAIGIGLSGAVVRLVPQADTPLKRGFVAGAAAAGLKMLAGPLGTVGVSRHVVNGVALGMGIDAAWRGTTGIRSKFPGLGGGGPTGGLLSGRNPFAGGARLPNGSRSVFTGSNVFDRLARVTQ